MNRRWKLSFTLAALTVTTVGLAGIAAVGPGGGAAADPSAGGGAAAGPGAGGGAAAPPVAAPPAAPAPAAALSEDPAPSTATTAVYQGLPVPASGSCADIQDADYSWGTGMTGGWRKGWEPWAGSADTGLGSWACIRTLVYSGNTWSIAS